MNRRSSGKTLLDLILEHFDELDRWSSDLADDAGDTVEQGPES